MNAQAISAGARMQLNSFLGAVVFLTRIPVGSLYHFQRTNLSRSVIFFPLVGALIGSADGIILAATHAFLPEMDELESVLASGHYDLVILDEINYCLHRGLIDVARAVALVERRPEYVELVFTGRYAPEELIARADVVTEMRKIKHHFDQGVQARRGIEF